MVPHGDDTDTVPQSDTDPLREHPVSEVAEQDGGLVVRLAGELDVYNSQLVREALAEAAGRANARLVVDLGNVSFVDSTMLGVLVEARTRLEDRRGFVLACPGLAVRRALEVSGLDRHFEVHESVDAALEAPLE